MRAAIIHRDPLLADACERALGSLPGVEIVELASPGESPGVDLDHTDVLVTIPAPPGAASAPAAAGTGYDVEVRAAVDAVLPGMVERGFGRIVVLVRASGLEDADGGDEAASHWAAVGIVRHVARHAAARGVAVNAVRVGLVDGHDVELPPTVAPPPLVRRGTPDEVAGAVGFLASADAGYVVGAVVPVDGGLSIGQGV